MMYKGLPDALVSLETEHAEDAAQTPENQTASGVGSSSVAVNLKGHEHVTAPHCSPVLSDDSPQGTNNIFILLAAILWLVFLSRLPLC